MTGLNKCSIIGNLTRDAELKNVNVGGVSTPCCRFSVAVNETRSNGEAITTYFDVTAWRDYATKIAPWLLKGRQVFVCGHVRLNQYTDANRSIRTTLQIHNPEVVLLGKKPEVETATLEGFDEIPC